MRNEISVRQWQEQFRAGAFDSKDVTTQCKAGWYDWFCSTEALAGRLKKIAKVVMGVTTPFILDNYYVWFKNNCPLDGPLYDDVRFEPLSEKRNGQYFVVTLDSPHERAKWTLVTERFGYESPEYECKNVRNMVQYINSMGLELAKNIKPSFIAEKQAVAAYAKLCGEPVGIPVRREGFRRYSYLSKQDRRKRTILVVSRLKEAPSDFAIDQAQQLNGLYVCCLEDIGIPPPEPVSPPQRQASKKKEVER